MKPQLVLPFVAILILRREWKVIAGFASGTAVLVLVSGAVVGFKTIIGYISFLRYFDRLPALQSAAAPANMPNLRGLLVTSLSGYLGAKALLVIVVLASGLVVIAASRLPKPAVEETFSVGISATLLASYHLYSYDVTLLLLPVILTFQQCREIFSALAAKTHFPLQRVALVRVLRTHDRDHLSQRPAFWLPYCWVLVW